MATANREMKCAARAFTDPFDDAAIEASDLIDVVIAGTLLCWYHSLPGFATLR
jgi:hypothetical protein